MRAALYPLAPVALASLAYTAAQSMATHDWLVAVPLLVVLLVGLVLIVPGEVTPSASAPPTPASATEDSALATASKAGLRA